MKCISKNMKKKQILYSGLYENLFSTTLQVLIKNKAKNISN